MSSITPGDGGGIRISGNEGILVLNNSVVTSNFAANQGGGIWNQAGSRVLIQGSVTSLDIVGNTAQSGHGGGIYNKGFLRALDATFESNTTETLDGGGLFNTRTGVAELNNVFLSGNSASRTGGGIANFGQLALIDAFFQSNTATTVGGALFTDADAVTTDSGSFFIGNVPQEQNV